MKDNPYKGCLMAAKRAGLQLTKDMARGSAWFVSVAAMLFAAEKLGVGQVFAYMKGAAEGPVLLQEIHQEVFSESGNSKIDTLQGTTIELGYRVGRLESRDSVDFESDHLARYEADLTGANIRVNRAYARLLGTGKAALMRFGWRNYIAADYSHLYDAQWKEAYAQGRYFRTLIKYRNPRTNEELLVTGEHFPMRDPITTELIGYQGILMSEEAVP